MLGAAWSHVRRHVVAYAALFVALGGTAVALPGKNGVKSDDIAPKAVKAGDLGNGAVKTKKLAKQAVKRGKIGPNAVGGAQADEASFKGLIQGGGAQSSKTFVADAVGFLPTPLVLADVPSMGKIQLIYCGTYANNDQMRVRQLSNDDAQDYIGVGYVTSGNLPAGTAQQEHTDFDAGHFSGGGGGVLLTQTPGSVNPGPFGIAALWDYKLYRGNGAGATSAHIAVSGFNDSTSTTPQGHCYVTADTVIQP